jgi:hypothetical protein
MFNAIGRAQAWREREIGAVPYPQRQQQRLTGRCETGLADPVLIQSIMEETEVVATDEKVPKVSGAVSQ